MAHEQISRAEALRRFDIERAASKLQEEASTRWPTTFAGVWIDIEPYGVGVAFTNNAESNVAELAKSFDYPSDLRAVTAPRSEAVLLALQKQMIDDRSALQEGTPPARLPAAIRSTEGIYDLGIDIRAAAITVRVERVTDPLRQAFQNTYSPAVILIEGVSQPAACTIKDCGDVMMGGIQLKFQNIPTSDYCTSAFTITSGGTRYLLSAGHCTIRNNAAERYHGGEFYGVVDEWQSAGPTDSERIPPLLRSNWRPTSKFFVQGEDPRMVSAFQKYQDMVIGTYIGKTGATTGTTRGYLTDRHNSVSWATNSYDFLTADACNSGGDSGGAVWRGTVAWGIVSGSVVTSACGSAPAGHLIFSAVGHALNDYGGLLFGVNLAPTADFTYSCPVLSNTCSFNGGPSSDPDGSISSYRWTFDDGTTKFGQNVSKTYSLPGPHTVTLTVTDNNGSTNSRIQAVPVT